MNEHDTILEATCSGRRPCGSRPTQVGHGSPRHRRQAECTVINFTVTEQGLEEPRGAHGADAMENDGVEVLADHRDTPWDYLRIHVM